METRPTPVTWLSFCASTVSAKSLTLSSGRLSEVMASERIGVSAGLTLLYVGGLGRPVGSTPLEALMAACTSSAAASISRSSTNWSVIVVLPNELTEFIADKPGIWPKLRSNGVVTDEAITSGLAPGSCAKTWIVGKSTAGSAEMGSS